LLGPHAESFRPIVARLKKVEDSSYPDTHEGAREALLELIGMATALRQAEKIASSYLPSVELGHELSILHPISVTGRSQKSDQVW
jgi:hypothetical protein